jgi:uncharacterized membrane protein
VAAALLAAVAALAIISPFFWKGNASGHDFEFHLRSWIDAAHSWHAGVWFPRWAELANWKFGEPRFIFYPPLSWMLGAALSLVLPWKMVPGAFIVLVLALAGATMCKLAREYLPPEDAVVAGVLFAANPYHMLVVYWRSAFAELLVSALFPLVVLYALRLPRERWRAVAPLALVFGLIWLTNVPGALMTSYALALVLAVMAWQERAALLNSWAVLALGGVAITIGLMLAAAFIVPAAVEQPWVRIREVLSTGLKPDENFLFTKTGDDLHTAFNLLVSKIALLQITVMAWVAWRGHRVRERLGNAWWPAVALGTFSTVIMVRITAPLWTVVPKAEFIQFPWRWLVVLSFCAALVGAASFLASRQKWAQWVVAALLLVLVARWLTAQFEWWDEGGAEQISSDAHDTGYEGSDEYAPLATDHYDLKAKQPRTAFLRDDTLDTAASEIVLWKPEEKRFTIASQQPEQLVVRLLDYPAWHVEVNGQAVRTEAREGTGEMVVPLAAGKSDVHITFARTRDRMLGDALSLLGVLLLLLTAWFGRRHRYSAHAGAAADIH